MSKRKSTNWKPKRRAVLPVNKPRVFKVKTKIIPRKEKYRNDDQSTET